MTKPMSIACIEPSNDPWRLSGIRRLVIWNDLNIMRQVITTLLLFCGLSFLGASATHAANNELFKLLPLNQATQFSAAKSSTNKLLDRIKALPTTKSVTLMLIDEKALQGKNTRMMLSSVKTVSVDKSNVETRSTADYTWSGSLSGVPGNAILVVRNGNITGSFWDIDDHYRIEPVGNGVHAVIKIDQSRFPPDHSADDSNMTNKLSIGQKSLGSLGTKKSNNVRVGVNQTPVDIDVMVAYTPEALAAVSDMKAHILLAVAETNQSYKNSDVKINLRLVDSFPINYSYKPASPQSDQGLDIVTEFSDLKDVQRRRDSVGADLSILLTGLIQDLCGRAFDFFPPVSKAVAFVTFKCAIGNYSFGHEIGHLLGADHVYYPNGQAAKPYGYGFEGNKYLDEAGRYIDPKWWRTIMWPSDGSKRLPYWSNPRIKWNGIPMGTVDKNDNARLLSESALIVSEYRRTRTQKFDDILFQRDDGLVHYWQIKNGKRLGGFDIGDASPVGLEERIAGVGDLSGDGTDDILLQRIDGSLQYWTIENGKRTEVLPIADASPIGKELKAVGVGDMNGDGNDDILLQRNDGSVHYWQIVNGKRMKELEISDASPHGLSWKLVGVGDLNGDGTDDIIWQNKIGLVDFCPIQNGKRLGKKRLLNIDRVGLDINFVGRLVGRGWKLISAGDLNGDGTDDILWQHSNGLVHYWPINNGKRLGGIDIGDAWPMGKEWKVVGIGHLGHESTQPTGQRTGR